MADQAPLVWIDCEMTGLDHETEEIIEIFCLITDGQLNLLDSEGWGAVIHQSEERMAQMDSWCQDTHGRTGLTRRVIESTTTPEQAASDLLAYIQRYVPQAKIALLSGNTVHQDKLFMLRQPYRKVVEHLHHRILDVSAIKEACKRWAPQIMRGAPRKKGTHQARDDIMESIEEAQFFKNKLFAPLAALERTA